MTEDALPSNLRVLAFSPEAASEFDISDPELVTTLIESQNRHFWFQARNRQVLDFLRREGIETPATFLEVGCGTGTVLTALSEAGYAVTGVELHTQLAVKAAGACPKARVDVFDVREPPAAVLGSSFDAVGLFDVMEHLDDPADFISSCARFLRPGGLLVGTVPALSILWSDYDQASGHRLRFDLGTLRSVLTSAGLKVRRCDYFFQILFPALFLRRLLIGRRGDLSQEDRRRIYRDSLQAPRAGANALLERVCGLERAIHRWTRLGILPGASIWFSAAV